MADGLALPDSWFAARNQRWAASRERLTVGLAQAGFAVLPNVATWFLCVDLTASGLAMDDRAYSERAVREAGVATIPVSAFYGTHGPQHILRLCFTKPDDVLDDAIERLAAFRRAPV